MNQKYNGKIPSIEIIEARKNLAKFVGLTLFKLGKECLMLKGLNCAIIGPCCSIHRLEGLKESHDLFPKLFEPFGVKFDRIDAVSDTFFTSLLAVYADFKTQIIVTDMILFLSNEIEISGQESSLSHRLENLLETYFGSAMHLSYLKGKLQDRAVHIRGILERGGSNKNLIESLQLKYPVDLFESNLRNVLKNVYSAFPETFLTELTSGKGKSANIKEKVTIKERELVSESAKESCKEFFKEPIVESAKENANPIISESISNTSFKDVIISGKFFRGILEPVDERFAAIIEANDINVRQYLSQRKKRAAMDANGAGNNKKSSAQSAQNIKSSLMERHNSAERISWETQERSPSPISEPEISIKETGKSVFMDELEFEDRQPGTSKKIRKTTVKRASDAPRGRRRFSEQEVMNLIEGIRRFGRDWRKILTNYEFEDRSNVDLKDKARNLEKLGLI